MKKVLGLCSLVTLNFSLLYLIYWYVYVAASIIPDNIFHIPYEPAGMQLLYYYISLPFFIIYALVSQLYRYYFDLRKSLSIKAILIWCSYFILIFYVENVLTFPAGNVILYYGSLIISMFATIDIIYSIYSQLLDIMNPIRLD